MPEENLSDVDIVGVGLNATDTMIRLPHFPAFNSKVEFRVSETLPGGQVATAVTACARWGLKARYVGKIGDDAAGRLQQSEMVSNGIEAHWVVVPGCQSQSSFILVDEPTGERTVLWKRDPRLELLPSDLRREWIVGGKTGDANREIGVPRVLHVDGHDCAGATQGARWAREAGILVMADLDNLYAGVELLLENVDFAITSREFPGRLTGEGDLFVSLPAIASRFGCRVTAATLGTDGVLAWDGERFHYSPAFEIQAVDTTGAGDVFHAGFAYALLALKPPAGRRRHVEGHELAGLLEFSCAAAGLACLGKGARGGIATLAEIEAMVRNGQRRAAAFTAERLEAARVAR